MKVKIILIIILFLLAGITIFAMGRMYDVKGIVVFLDESKKHWFMQNHYEMNQEHYPELGTPVEHAQLTFFYDLDKKNLPVRDSVWHKTIFTNEQGIFNFSDYGPPSKKATIGVEVVCDGYATSYFTYTDYINREHYFYIILDKTF
ncbi:MAG: hypothetical protein JXJ04_22605 [Spirochaetales bacterium]|nr:hypothetical protein [Spirochaetales bacterium]